MYARFNLFDTAYPAKSGKQARSCGPTFGDSRGDGRGCPLNSNKELTLDMSKAETQNDTVEPTLQQAVDALKHHARLVAALQKAVGAAEFIIKICEADYEAGASPSPCRRSMPSAALAHCYGAVAYVGEARALLEEIGSDTRS